MSPTTLNPQAADEHIPTNMPSDNRPLNLGRSMNDDASRLDAVAKVTGAAKYGRDLYLPSQLFVGFVRCPFGAAKLLSSNQDAAKAVPGVVEIVINGDSGRYHGHSVGYIVAESKTALRRARRALQAKWERNGELKTQITDSVGEPPEPSDKTRELLRGADGTIQVVYSTPVQTHSALETHGVVVDHKGDSAVVHASTQGTFSVRDGIGDALGLPGSQFEVRCEYVGGGFGAKFGPGKEGQIAAEVAAKHKRPVSLFVDRDEEHLDTGNRPSSRTAVSIGYKRDGTILGGQIQTWGGVGVAGGGGGCSVPSGRYRLGEIQKNHDDVKFNGGAPRAMRAPGHPQGAFAEELMLDEVAAATGIDPLDLRLKLDVEPDRHEMYRLAASSIGWERRQKNGAQSGLIRRGFGMGSCSWGAFPAQAEAEIVIHRDGSVEVRSGSQDIGTGQRTVLGIVASEKLGIPLDRVSVRIGSSSLPEGPGSGGSVTAPNTSVAVAAAAVDARQKLLTAVAERSGGDASEFSIVHGEIHRGGTRAMGWQEACQRMGADAVTGRARNDAASRELHFGKGHSHGVQAAEVEVDAETGVVHVRRIVAVQACGRVVCRKTAESQIIGGVIQGLSFALFENKLLDRRTGAMVNPNLEFYKIAGAADMPLIEPILWDKGQTGVRSLGEPPVVPTAGAIACAVFNAVGSPVRDLPITPDKVLAVLALVAKGGA